jgi:hypothetical protein
VRVYVGGTADSPRKSWSIFEAAIPRLKPHPAGSLHKVQDSGDDDNSPRRVREEKSFKEAAAYTNASEELAIDGRLMC